MSTRHAILLAFTIVACATGPDDRSPSGGSGDLIASEKAPPAGTFRTTGPEETIRELTIETGASNVAPRRVAITLDRSPCDGCALVPRVFHGWLVRGWGTFGEGFHIDLDEGTDSDVREWVQSFGLATDAQGGALYVLGGPRVVRLAPVR